MPAAVDSDDTADSGDASLVSLDEIRAAAERIAGLAVRTPLLPSQSPELANIWLKCENLQRSGSFKIRGATNAVAMLSSAELANGVIAHSSGNHAQALALAARAAGTRATIVMPYQSRTVKQEATKALGAEVVLVDAADRLVETERLRRASGAALVPPYDDARVIAGQGTIGLEIVADLPPVGVVLVPVSGGGLISGIATAVKALRPDTIVVGVEPELAGDLAEGFAAGQRVAWEVDAVGRTIADGLRVPEVGDLPWRHIRRYVDDVVTVTEDEIRSAMRELVYREHLVVEAAGAVPYAAARSYADRWAGRQLVCVLSGGNVDPTLFAEVVAS